MKKEILVVLAGFGSLLPAAASLAPTSGTDYSTGNVNGSGAALNETVPVDEYPAGIASSISVSGAEATLSSVSVTLNISGGWNGDLMGYLSYNGTAVTLLNFVGTGTGDAFQSAAGFSTSGFNNITLADGGSGGNIHGVESPVQGVSYAPDSGSGPSLSSFNGMNPNGTWTLFLADNSGPDQSVLEGWSLDITAVPEPITIALPIFGGLILTAGMVRFFLARRTAPQPKA